VLDRVERALLAINRGEDALPWPDNITGADRFGRVTLDNVFHRQGIIDIGIGCELFRLGQGFEIEIGKSVQIRLKLGDIGGIVLQGAIIEPVHAIAMLTDIGPQKLAPGFVQFGVICCSRSGSECHGHGSSSQ